MNPIGNTTCACVYAIVLPAAASRPEACHSVELPATTALAEEAPTTISTTGILKSEQKINKMLAPLIISISTSHKLVKIRFLSGEKDSSRKFDPSLSDNHVYLTLEVSLKLPPRERHPTVFCTNSLPARVAP